MRHTDLLGHAVPQGDLFAGEGAPERPRMDFPAEARARLTRALAQARAATSFPWPDREVRMWQVLFPQMSGWLPDDEARQLCLEFEQEMERLRRAA